MPLVVHTLFASFKYISASEILLLFERRIFQITNTLSGVESRAMYSIHSFANGKKQNFRAKTKQQKKNEIEKNEFRHESDVCLLHHQWDEQKKKPE